MKNIFALAIFTVAFLSLASCQNKKEPETSSLPMALPGTDTAASLHATSAEPNLSSNAAETQETARFSVTFYSKGEGIDTKTKDEFEQFLANYPKKIAYQPVSHGREGETEYNLTLSELSPAEQDEFVKKAKDLLKKSDRVHINENVPPGQKH